jgi:two-component system, NarL family, response regulator DesR
MSDSPLKLLIADDNELFVSALEGLLANDVSVRVVARAPNGKSAAELAAELRPDVVLMDLSMPHMDGFEATKTILADTPDTAIVVLTGSDDPADHERAHTAGAAGYVTKDRILVELLDTIHSAAAER